MDKILKRDEFIKNIYESQTYGDYEAINESLLNLFSDFKDDEILNAAFNEIGKPSKRLKNRSLLKKIVKTILEYTQEITKSWEEQFKNMKDKDLKQFSPLRNYADKNNKSDKESEYRSIIKFKDDKVNDLLEKLKEKAVKLAKQAVDADYVSWVNSLFDEYDIKLLQRNVEDLKGLDSEVKDAIKKDVEKYKKDVNKQKKDIDDQKSIEIKRDIESCTLNWSDTNKENIESIEKDMPEIDKDKIDDLIAKINTLIGDDTNNLGKNDSAIQAYKNAIAMTCCYMYQTLDVKDKIDSNYFKKNIPDNDMKVIKLAASVEDGYDKKCANAFQDVYAKEICKNPFFDLNGKDQDLHKKWKTVCDEFTKYIKDFEIKK